MYDPDPDDDAAGARPAGRAACPVQAILSTGCRRREHGDGVDGGPDRDRRRVAGRAAGRRGAARRGASRLADHDRRRALRALRPAAAVQAGADRLGGGRAHRAAAPSGRSTPTGGSASRAVGPGPGRQAGAAGRRHEVGFDRLLIATGVRARPWPNPAEAALDGVFVAAHPRRRGRAAAAAGERAAAGCWSSAPGSPAPRSPRSAASSACR